MAEEEEIIMSPSSSSETTTTNNNKTLSESVFDPITMRKTKPGLKRLALTLSVLFSFLLGLPWLLKSIEIYRAPLPFREIDTLSFSIESNPLVFPCKFHAVFVNFDNVISTDHNAAVDLGTSIVSQMQRFSDGKSSCGTCGSDYILTLSLDSSSDGCVHYTNVDGSYASSWKCGALKEFKFDESVNDDVEVDEYLESLIGRDEKVYTVVVVNRDEGAGVKSVVGKHRHAWILGGGSEMDAYVEKLAEVFVKVFVYGGKEEGVIRSEFMPVGADGRIVLSFNLMNTDPRDWIFDWDLKEIDENILTPTVEALHPVANISIESQVLYHTPKSSFSYWDDKMESYIFSTKDLPFFVNSNEWHLDTSIAAGGRSKILHFVVYVPSAIECPLMLQLPNGETSMTNGFISPMWGGVVVWNPPGCWKNSDDIHPLKHKIPQQELTKIFEVFMGQLRQLFGLKSDGLYRGPSGPSVVLGSERGFTEWELDVLSRQYTCFNLLQCGTTLGSLSRLVQSLPRMIIKDEIGKQVKYSLEAADLAQSNATLGIYDASAVSSRHARSLAEDAFYHPSIMSVSYYSFEHCFAVYSPFFLPVSLHVLLAVIRELKRYKQESRKYAAWKAKIE